MSTFSLQPSKDSDAIFNSPQTSLSLTIYTKVQNRIDSSNCLKKIATLVDIVGFALIFSESLLRCLAAIASLPLMTLGCVNDVFRDLPGFLFSTSYKNLTYASDFLYSAWKIVLF
jgi:hypothetical protein